MPNLTDAKRLDWRTVLTAADNTPGNVVAALDEYFKPFAQPSETDGQPCLKCGEPLTGFASMLLGKGGFEWGMVHGEGHCRNCGWPARAHHFIKDKDGDLLTIRNVVLQYHPDEVSEEKARA